MNLQSLIDYWNVPWISFFNKTVFFQNGHVDVLYFKTVNGSWRTEWVYLVCGCWCFLTSQMALKILLFSNLCWWRLLYSNSRSLTRLHIVHAHPNMIAEIWRCWMVKCWLSLGTWRLWIHVLTMQPCKWALVELSLSVLGLSSSTPWYSCPPHWEVLCSVWESLHYRFLVNFLGKVNSLAVSYE